MARKINKMVAAVAFMVIGTAIFAPSASAFGQCGGTVSTGSQLYNAWQAMGVTSQAAKVVESAGFHRMDGSLKSWMSERVVKAKLAKSAAPVDFGCHPGELFSVGNRALGKGEAVMVALPLKMAKSDVRTTPHKGFKRVVVRVHIVGKSTCSNPEEGVVSVVFYVKTPKHPKPHHKKHHKKKPPPTCESLGLIGTAGNCVVQSNNAKQECEATVSGRWEGNQCTIIQINNNCGNVNVGSEGTVNQGNNCNTVIVEEKPCGCEPKVEPPVVHLETIQEMETKEVRTICAHVESPNGDPVTVHFEAEYGNFANSGTGSLVPGSDRYCDTYTAPTERPKNASHCDTIEVLVRDTKTNKSATDKKSVEIIEETLF